MNPAATRITEPAVALTEDQARFNQRIAARVRQLHADDEEQEIERLAKVQYNNEREAAKAERRNGGQA